MRSCNPVENLESFQTSPYNNCDFSRLVQTWHCHQRRKQRKIWQSTTLKESCKAEVRSSSALASVTTQVKPTLFVAQSHHLHLLAADSRIADCMDDPIVRFGPGDFILKKRVHGLGEGDSFSAAKHCIVSECVWDCLDSWSAAS